VDHVADEFVKVCGVDPRDDAISYQTLYSDCRRAKQTLSKLRRTTVQCNHAGKFHRVEITREKFERLTRSLLSKTEMTVEACIRDGGLTWDRLDGVLLIGGSTRMPMIRDMLERVTGKQPRTDLDPDLAVAIGAAIYAAALDSRGPIGQESTARTGPAEDEKIALADDEDIVLPDDEEIALAGDREIGLADDEEPVGQLPESDESPAEPDDDDLALVLNLVNPHGIGIFARNRGEKANVVMIPKNSELPVEQTREFRTNREGVREINAIISEGDTKQREACEVLGKCVLGPLPKSLPKGSPISLSIGYDRDGRVRVSACCKTTGTQVEAEIQTDGILSDEEVEREREYFANLNVT